MSQAPTSEEVRAAIATIEECRDIHVDYADWQDATPDWREQCVPDENTGGPEHHRQWVAKYDGVLDVLRGML